MDYLRLMRVKHYVKNLLVFVPLFFGRGIFSGPLLFTAAQGFVCFCLASSAVYIFNDIKDVEKDKNHPKKKNRPIASGRVSKTNALILLAVCVLGAAGLTAFSGNWLAAGFLGAYLLLNVGYSAGLKDIPIVDVVILASGFVLRVLYGGALTGIEISNWLYLVIVSGSLYMGLGKRRNELRRQTDTRTVLKFYNEAFLDKNMYVAVSLVIVFYALWAMESTSPAMIWTVPAVMIILMRYSFDVEGNSDGDPVEVILHDKALIALAGIYALAVFVLYYLL